MIRSLTASRRFIQRALLASVVVAAAILQGSPPTSAQTTLFDIRSIVVPVEELPSGYSLDATRTILEERASVTSYEVRYVRGGPTDSGPAELGLAVARTSSGKESSLVMSATRDTLNKAGWSERGVPLLGDEAIGFSTTSEPPSHAYIFRYGRHVLGATIYGPGKSSFEDALGYAVRLSSRLDGALAKQPVPDPEPFDAIAFQTSQPTTNKSPAPVVAAAPPAAPATAPQAAPVAAPASAPVSSPTLHAQLSVEELPDIDAGFTLGGFSGLFAVDGSGASFLSLTDRGPNGEIRVGGKKEMAFPVPGYTPRIVKLKLEGGRLRVSDTIPLRVQQGHTDSITRSREITGLPNPDDGETPYRPDGRERLPNDPHGVDTEGIALDPRDGSFWIGEEYGPSILHVAPDGTILNRLMPKGRGLDAPGEGVLEILPGALMKRKDNRGFEGIAISPDGSRVFAMMQSPLLNPDKKAGEASRSIRLVVIDSSNPKDPRFSGMFVYQGEPFRDVGAAEQDDIKIGDMYATSDSKVLVVERDSAVGGSHKMVFLMDLKDATDVTDRDGGGKTIEQMNDQDFKRAGINMIKKTPVVDLAQLGYRHEKLEGLTLVDTYTLAVVNDNDFGIESIDSRGRITRGGPPTEIVIIKVPEPLR